MTPDRRAIAALLHPLRGYADRITQRADTEARAADLTVEVLPRGCRRYRDPRLDQLAVPPVVAPYAGVRNASRADDEAWSIPTLTTAAALVAVSRHPPASTTRPGVPVLPAGPVAPATSPPDRLRRTDSWQGPGRYQTRSPASSRPAQDRSQAAPLRSATPGTILRSRLDPGHPAGPEPDALRAGSEEHTPARPVTGPTSAPPRSVACPVSPTPERETAMSTTITTEANLTADPELRFTKVTGQAVATIRLAVSARRKNMDGEYEDTPPVFYEATVWGALAENAADTFHKGDRAMVHGSTYDEEWTDRDGHTRVKHVLQVTALGASLRYATATLTRTTTKSTQSEPAEVG